MRKSALKPKVYKPHEVSPHAQDVLDSMRDPEKEAQGRMKCARGDFAAACALRGTNLRGERNLTEIAQNLLHRLPTTALDWEQAAILMKKGA